MLVEQESHCTSNCSMYLGMLAVAITCKSAGCKPRRPSPQIEVNRTPAQPNTPALALALALALHCILNRSPPTASVILQSSFNIPPFGSANHTSNSQVDGLKPTAETIDCLHLGCLICILVGLERIQRSSFTAPSLPEDSLA
ncbi:hypothetical protein HRR80_007165 [Exophiala dermatitidis]|uniref:Uncharacterized protein n=1 Tax=Exophiala dermatitidis TaxID=5970 RepID=A0AAN6IVN1_EXODE|nr:hypothetical protein HRR77_002493 [Exophiala dermatitidis]KAJ4568437.1 hypothetical protein HRR79_004659 [Exophiala dermatitidis]KAJ4579243.1 hypothetical protein HRR82_005033 [Exophiala dermatitidis]KAJ4610354.1 hypothetical protein HRR85_005618 [Exophiala dermatitidis]KAJ4626122.1 hypothetical protein HRR86_004543 [Exophiala dermatitidis]